MNIEVELLNSRPGNIRLDKNPAAMSEKSQITPVDDIAHNTQKLEEKAKQSVGSLGFYHD